MKLSLSVFLSLVGFKTVAFVSAAVPRIPSYIHNFDSTRDGGEVEPIKSYVVVHEDDVSGNYVPENDISGSSVAENNSGSSVEYNNNPSHNSSSSDLDTSESTHDYGFQTQSEFGSLVPCNPFVEPQLAFEDGKYDCQDFPAQQPGIVSRNDLGWGGWTGIQRGNEQLESCEEGAYCSYACQNGMMKTQWPENQPSDGQTRGGLICQGGKLYRTRPEASALCTWGTDTVKVISELSQPVAICQTDYPGTENMVIPTLVEGKEPVTLAVINSPSYFQWQGTTNGAKMGISSHFYVNKAGLSIKEGCIWSTEGSELGNWAPVVFGASTNELGHTYLSIKINELSPYSKLNYNVAIVAGPGSNVNGNCVYENGIVYKDGVESDGCTAAVMSGHAYYKLY